ncbi:zinc-binding dehydrogenase [Leucobacter sp. W1038]|uniref:zinc-binding dehydrogenase n=1 Tax=Leucobacter sp. W1038 TaxID=3438281 RepID=UPI003D95E28D
MPGVEAVGAVLRELGAPLVVESIQLDEVTSHEVRVRVHASGVCRSDLTVAHADHGFPLPLMLGHEIAGTVEAIGSAVRGIAVGDHVVACPVNHCGRCARCRNGQPFLCHDHHATARTSEQASRVSVAGESVTQFIGIGGFADRVVLHENLVVPIPHEVPFDVACLLGCGVSTGLGAVLNTAGVTHGDTVVVVGCGGVGLNAVQGARIAGARRIIAIDLNDEALRLATELGATDVINSSYGDPVAEVKRVTNGLGVTHAFEIIGRPETLEIALASLGKGGSAYLVGVQKPDAILGIPFRHFFDQKSVHGVAMGSTIPQIHIPEYAELYLQGRLRLDELVANRITLAEVNEGLDRLRTGGVARSVILFE